MKVTIIGGGSYLWSYGFCQQFIHSDTFRGATICLMDIDVEALELVTKAVELENVNAGNFVSIESTTSREEALKEANFVIVSISTGGLDAMQYDLEIPEKYGIYHTVGDTVGPGGWSRAVRNIPVLKDISESMNTHCPDAWLINVTNPLTVLTRVAGQQGLKTFGFCPGVEEHVRSLATLCDLDSDVRVDYRVTGIDHGSFITELFADGQDLLHVLKEKGFFRSDGDLPSLVETEDKMAVTARSHAIFAIWKEFGYMPGINDRHMVENWPFFQLRAGEALPYGIQRTSVKKRRDLRETRREALVKFIEHGGREKIDELGHGEDPIVEIIEALLGKKPLLYGSNYQNIGQIAEAPMGAVVETRCLFDGAGVHPLCSPMPSAVQSVVLPHIYRQEASIDVVLDGNFDDLVSLVISDPLCSHLSIVDCRKMLQEMLEANQKWIQNPKLLGN